MEKLTPGMQSVINFMAKKPGGIWIPKSIAGYGQKGEFGDWGQGRSRQALRALVSRGLVIDEGKLTGDKQHYGFYALTDEARKLVKNDD
jgi:hypothetical protein